MIQQFGRGIAGIIGFKSANIQGLLVARGGFDRARDIVSQKSAAKLIDQQLTPSFGRTLSPKTTATVSGLAGQLFEDSRIRKAPKLPPSFQPMGDQSAVPNINPAAFSVASIDQTGLTPSENAFLDEQEKVMKLRERGIA